MPDNACSLAMISTVMMFPLSESEKLFSCVMIQSENIDAVDEFTLTSIVLSSELDALVISRVI